MKQLIKVYSHPRSGTHFLEAFLAKNFYQGEDLEIPEILWGHWSNRKVKKTGNPYGKLFGSHNMYEKAKKNLDHPSIYIYRDGRAVTYSLWKTPNFTARKLPFREFLTEELDWIGSPSIKADGGAGMNIMQHWDAHVTNWRKANNKNLLCIRYEDLQNNPEKVAKQIVNKFDFLSLPEKIDPVSKPVGLLPNKAKQDSWKSEFTAEDELLLLRTVGRYNPSLYMPKSPIWHIRNILF